MTELLPYLLTAIALGFTAGVTPGPISALAFAETLAGGWRRGVWVAVAPAFTDVPLVLVVWLVSVRLSPLVLAGLAILGAAFLLFLAAEAWRSSSAEPTLVRASGDRSPLVRAILANLLNPNPYLFWTFVGVPLLGAASTVAELGAPAVVGAFLLSIVGTKIVFVAFVDRSRHLLRGAAYRWTIRGAAGLLGLIAVVTLADGIERIVA